MKIYFAGSIRGGREDAALYGQLIEHIKTHGSVLTEHLGNVALGSYGETQLSDTEIFNRDVSMIHEADVIIAEVTNPSLGVGYELGLCEALQKKVLCLYRPAEGKRLSAMVSGNSFFTVKNYLSFEEGCTIIDAYMAEVS